MDETYQIYVKLLDGKHRALNFTYPSIPILSIKSRIREITGVPIDAQRLVTGTKNLEDSSLLRPLDGTHSYPAVHLLLPPPWWQGGFGSLLRGAATKAGQKKTNNFDACRDMSGRRLRHVNVEKKLEEWKAEAEERRLEKIAEDFIKKKVKAVKKGGRSGGRREVHDGNHLDSNKEEEGSSGSVTGRKLDGESSGGVSSESGSEEEETAMRRSSLSVGSPDAGMVANESNDDGEPALETHGERMLGNGDGPFSQKTLVSGTEACKAEMQESNQPESGNLEGKVGQPQNISWSGDGGVLDCGTIDGGVGLNSESKSVVHDETVVASTDVVKPLNLDEFNSAAELEELTSTNITPPPPSLYYHHSQPSPLPPFYHCNYTPPPPLSNPITIPSLQPPLPSYHHLSTSPTTTTFHLHHHSTVATLLHHHSPSSLPFSLLQPPRHPIHHLSTSTTPIPPPPSLRATNTTPTILTLPLSSLNPPLTNTATTTATLLSPSPFHHHTITLPTTLHY
ncbi:ubiquitin-like superfamily protein [Actinidia rufa]|uniref:Ubiquitin-like superfamily protein n=1 Tax=Actinidia rufa TaxID=165716 RepID=A0A7J0FG85_9ERIC|nr:ubiquitin-like superfamily protein [Actinidia rufa]